MSSSRPSVQGATFLVILNASWLYSTRTYLAANWQARPRSAPPPRSSTLCPFTGDTISITSASLSCTAGVRTVWSPSELR